MSEPRSEHAPPQVDVVIVLPVSDDHISSGLYELSKVLGTMNPDAQSHGLLGGEWGYGQDFSTDAFEMFPFWWGDCDCGREESEAAWCEAHPHATDCYHSELERRCGPDWENIGKNASALAAEWGLPERGCIVHCTCGQQERYETWLTLNDHNDRCSAARPNFRHFASGFEVRWYKYIGRSMEVSRPVTVREWMAILADCYESLEAAQFGSQVPPA